MKRMTFVLWSLLIPSWLSAEPLAVLNQELDQRIEVNKAYKTEYAESAKDSQFAHELVPLEEKNGQDWVDFITYVRKSDDAQLKIYVLKIELQTELAGYLYDLEYAEGLEEKTEIFQKIETYKAKLKAVHAAEAVLKAPAPASTE